MRYAAARAAMQRHSALLLMRAYSTYFFMMRATACYADAHAMLPCATLAAMPQPARLLMMRHVYAASALPC